MSEPRAIPDEERPFIPEEGFPDRDEERSDAPSDREPDDTAGVAPEDEPDAFAGDAPDDLSAESR